MHLQSTRCTAFPKWHLATTSWVLILSLPPPSAVEWCPSVCLSCSSYNLPFSHLSHQRPVPPLIIPLTPGLGSGVALVYSSAASSYTAPRLLSCSSATPPFSTTAFQQAMPLGVLVGMWHDLPETPRQEEQLRRAKVAAEAASDAKSIVLRNMRHEICTPMHANNPVLLVPLTRSLPFPSPFHLLPVCRFGLPFTSPSSPLTLPFLCLLLPISPPLSLPFSSLSPPISLRFPSSSVLLASPSPPFSIPFPSLSPPDPLPIPSRFPPIPIPVPSPSPPRSLPFPSPSSLITCTCIFSEQSKIDSQRPSALPRASRTFGSALSLKRSMYYQPETYRHAQEDKAPGTCIKEGPSGRAIRGCWGFQLVCVDSDCGAVGTTDLAIIDSQSLPLEGVNTLFPLPSGGREYSLPPSLWRA
ncbi:unnamed protein product [Closterium sp. NIES-65]|nr:unnamed protein product [Closterium sp. NIES-65]